MTYKETRKDWTPDDDGERNRNLAYCVQLKHPLHVRACRPSEIVCMYLVELDKINVQRTKDN